nr:immunoglobulin heavy chain junction region [Macaca mulatta]MOV86595.1 immunoglobulin heavy chain junction region [Macaca mulatta]MOV86689.1 immunoglobulin heavy chain junction region [Macaca mulatta]MOV86697.1 immunoglobulin heavy chain junction region [Macaca mulatta]MOV86704.1 immunoglobulin heavy chain junction region [Macaca mulatta]
CAREGHWGDYLRYFEFW